MGWKLRAVPTPAGQGRAASTLRSGDLMTVRLGRQAAT